MKRIASIALSVAFVAFSVGACKSTNKNQDSNAQGLMVPNSDGVHDLFLWVTSKNFNNEVNICLFFNQQYETTPGEWSDANEEAIFKSENTYPWNSNYIAWKSYRRAMIATAQKIKQALQSGTNQISYTAYADGRYFEKSITVDANKYAEFVSWFMMDLKGRAPSKVDRKSEEIFQYIYAVMDNIDDRDQVSGNQCGKSANKNLLENANVDDAARLDLYKAVRGELKAYLTSTWATGAAWWPNQTF